MNEDTKIYHTFSLVLDIQHLLDEQLNLWHVCGVDVSVDHLIDDTVHANLQKPRSDETSEQSAMSICRCEMVSGIPEHQYFF